MGKSVDFPLVRQKLAAFRKAAHIPIVASGDLGPDYSKFSGVAWINQGESWPTCGYCGKHMQLFLQLNLSTLPQSVEGWPQQGFCQVFYCTNPTSYCNERGQDAFGPFGKFVCSRVIPRVDAPAQFAASPVENPIAAKSITGWISRDDYPSVSDVENLSRPLYLDPAMRGTFMETESARSITRSHPDYVHPLQDTSPTTWFSDKLFGWPLWLQHVSYPKCSDCGTPMRNIAQLDSNRGLDYTFGDMGIAWLYCCPVHSKQLGFSWDGC